MKQVSDHLRAQADGLEDLRAGVGGDGGHAHLGHDLQQALAERLEQVGLGLAPRSFSMHAAPDQVPDRLDGQVRVDRGGAVADEQRDVVALADVAGLHHEADPGAGLLLDQVVVHRAGQQQRREWARGRDRRRVAAVGQDDEAAQQPRWRPRPRRRCRASRARRPVAAAQTGS